MSMNNTISNQKKLIYGLDPSKYPSRMGQPWKQDEIVKLLRSIQKKKSIEDIAKEHDRTTGGILSYIKKLAIDYYFNDKRPIEDIQKFTGLTREQVEDAIRMHEIKHVIKKPSEPIQPKLLNKNTTEEEVPTMAVVVSLLRDIQDKLNTLIEKTV